MPPQALTLDEYANQDVKTRGNHSTALWEMPRQVLPTKSAQHTFDAECKSHNYTILYPHPLWSNHLRPKTFIECSVTYCGLHYRRREKEARSFIPTYLTTYWPNSTRGDLRARGEKRAVLLPP